jgi:hypothetical protein
MLVAPIPISLLLRAIISVEVAILPVLLAQIYPVGTIFAFIPIVIILVLAIVVSMLRFSFVFVMLLLSVLSWRI